MSSIDCIVGELLPSFSRPHDEDTEPRFAPDGQASLKASFVDLFTRTQTWKHVSTSNTINCGNRSRRFPSLRFSLHPVLYEALQLL